MYTVDTTYTTDDDPVLKNPERGLFHNRIPDPSNPCDYHTLLPAYLYLDTVCDADLAWNGNNEEGTSPVLNSYAADLDRYRSKGVKVVFRPRYDDRKNHGPNRCGMFHTDTIDRLHNHIDAVAKMVNDYKDVVGFIQAGYLGRWGEWNTEDHPKATAPFLYDDGARAHIIDYVLTTYAQYQIKQDVELRRPVFAREVTGRNADANVGLHSDCFMSSESDGGTYSDFEHIDANFHNVHLAKRWAQEFTGHASFGGETCNHGGEERWRDCSQMLTELAEMHVNYLNGDYSQHAIGVWSSGNCLDDILRMLGYRFEVTRVEYTPTVAPGQTYEVHIDVRNVGWAGLQKPRQANLVLRNGTMTQVHDLANGATADWAPRTATRLSVSAAAPVTPGTYSVRLAIPDPDGPTQIAYAVKLATLRNGTNVFDSDNGENNLGVSITVK